MSQEHELEQSFTQAVQALTRHFVWTEGVVLDSDPVNYTCTVQVGGAQGAKFLNVPIGVNIKVRGGDVQMPDANTDCILTFLDGNLQRPQLIKCDQIGDWLINCKGTVIYNDGTLGGLTKTLILLQKLNNLENDLNTIKQAFMAWVVVPNDGGAALKAIAATWAGSPLTPTEQAEIEDTKIKH